MDPLAQVAGKRSCGSGMAAELISASPIYIAHSNIGPSKGQPAPAFGRQRGGRQ
jgi:hypothetical protein